jgi:hypothetical protein
MQLNFAFIFLLLALQQFKLHSSINTTFCTEKALTTYNLAEIRTHYFWSGGGRTDHSGPP